MTFEQVLAGVFIGGALVLLAGAGITLTRWSAAYLLRAVTRALDNDEPIRRND